MGVESESPGVWVLARSRSLLFEGALQANTTP